jgi:flagellin-like protein
VVPTFRADRGISPVIGTVLLVGIVVILIAVSAALFFGIADTSDPAPRIVMDADSQDDGVEYTLRHERGDTVDGDNVRLEGAADPDATVGDRLTAGYEVTVYPTAEEIAVVWYDDRDTSYVLTTVEVSRAFPEPDEGCDWVDDESNGGSDPITIDGLVVNCDVETNDQVEVQNGGAVVGEVVSDSKELDADDAEIYGDVDVEKVLNVQNGTVTGDATSRTADVKIHTGSTVEGSVEAEKVAEVTDGSEVEGDVQSRSKDAKILDSTVGGAVTANGTVKLDGADVAGHVYADPSDFDCTDSTINGESCGSYTPKDPENW